MNLREFSKECVQRGYMHREDTFCRCIGDGIFQMIYVGGKEKLSVDSPLYSHMHKLERTVGIYLKSIYGDYIYGIDSASELSLSVTALKGTRNAPERFYGSSVEYEKMVEFGFNRLDELNSHAELEKFLFNWYNFDKNEIRYDFRYYDLFLYLGEYYKARKAVEELFTHNCFALYNRYNRIKPEDSIEQYIFKESSFIKFYELYMLTWPVFIEDAKRRLASNKRNNLERLKQIGLNIATVPLGTVPNGGKLKDE